MPSIDQSVDTLSIVRGHALHGALRILYDGSSNPQYVGWARPGTLTSAAAWRICRITGGATPTAIEWADGNAEYDNVWNNAVSLTYS